MRYGFIHTDHLSSPISNLLLGHCRRRQQSTTSIFNLRSHIWGGWLGARIYNLHSPSPISTFWPCCCSERSAIHNLNLRSLVLNGEPDRTDLLARLGRVRVRDPLGSPVLIYYLYPNDLLVLRRDVHYSMFHGSPRAEPRVTALGFGSGWSVSLLATHSTDRGMHAGTPRATRLYRTLSFALFAAQLTSMTRCICAREICEV